MKITKITLSLLLTLLMLLSVCPAALAENSSTQPPPESDLPDTETIAPPPEETGDDEFTYEYSWVDGDLLITPILPDPKKNVEMPQNASEDVDWDAAFDAMQQALYTGEKVDVLRLRIPYTEENRTYVSSASMNSPVFLFTCPRYNITDIGGVPYFSYFYSSAETSADYRIKYDACMDAIESLMYGIKDDPQLSMTDKCLLLHDRLCAWCEYDEINYLKQRAHQGTIPPESHSAYGPLALHIGVCNGIALAYNWMLDILGAENYLISSDALDHSWTMLYLDREPYFADVTWDDPVWDVPGYVEHLDFLKSHSAFHMNHNANDYSDLPSSTRYEDYFSKPIFSQIVYINGAMYYLNDNRIIKRLPDGTETEETTIDRSLTYQDGSYYRTIFSPGRILAVGDSILYLTPRAVRAYNTATGEDTAAYTASEALFPENNYRLMGLEQADGVVTVYSYTRADYTDILRNVDNIPVYLERSALCESFTFCSHDHAELLERQKGDSCLSPGASRNICPDCASVIYIPGEGICGDHSYAAETVKPEAFAQAASCALPAQYYYSCEFCGRVEADGDHTFSVGEPSAHPYQSAVVPAAPGCPGYTKKTCPDCGSVVCSDYTFYNGSSANGLIGDAFAWQIVDGVLSICGSGDLPDFTADAPAGWNAYANEITSLTVNDGITGIGAYCFCGLNQMTQMTLPQEVVYIGSHAFSDANKLKAFVMPRSLETIGAYAFENAKALLSVTNNDVIRSIGTYAFTFALSLKHIVIPSSVAVLGAYAYSYCLNCETIVIEEGLLTDLPSFYWYGWTSVEPKLTEIRIPANIINISSNTASNSLSDCQRITVAEDNPYYTSVDGVLYTKDMKNLVLYPANRPGTYYFVPASVTGIGNRAFTRIRKLGYLDLKNTSVSVLGLNQFNKDQSSMHVNLPSELMTISGSLFNEANIPAIYIPESVTAVDPSFYTAGPYTTVFYTDSADAAVKSVCDEKELPCTVLAGHVHDFSTVAYTETGADCRTAAAEIRTCGCGEFEIAQTYAGHSFTADTVKTDALKKAASCAGPAEYYYSCAVCGAVEHNDAHTFTSGSATAHAWQWIEDTAPACGTAGVRHEECGVCHAKRNENTPVAPTGSHSFTAETVKPDALKNAASCAGPAEYYYSCAVCGAVEHNDAHTFTSGSAVAHDWHWIEDTAPTCGTAGVRHEECGVCHAKRNENTPVAPTGSHTFTAATVKPDALINAASCAGGAEYYYSCAVCGAVEGDDTHTFTAGEPSGHDWAWITDREPTCGKTGVKHEECSVCHEKRNENTPIDPTGSHTFTAATVKNDALKKVATCSGPAEYYYSCAVCGIVEKNDMHVFTSGTSAGHQFGWIVDREPTCTRNGAEHEECVVCHEKRNQNTVIPATGEHAYSAKTVNDDTLKSAATCSDPAAYYYSCAGCGKIEHNDAHAFASGSALGHSYGDWITDNAATCAEAGKKHRACERCGSMEKAEIAKLNHTDANADGFCDTCGAEIPAAEICPYCHGTHTGTFGSMTAFFHRLLLFFRTMFRK